MSQKPAPPLPLQSDKGGSDSQFDRWLFLFYSWVTAKISSIFGTDVLVKTATSDFTSERVVTDTTSVVWDWSTSGQAKADVQDEFIEDTVGLMLSDTATINLSYNDLSGLITADLTADLDELDDVVITTVADNNVLQYDTATSKWINRTYLRLSEVSDPGFADANESWLHAEDVSGITQLHENTSTHKWAIGQDNWIVARNTSGVSIAAGKAVYVTGSTGARPEIAMADADAHHHAFGVAADTMANNAYGAVVTHGYVKNIDTSAWVAGDSLYASGTAGDLTTTEPTFPAGSQRLAIVIYSHATQGILFVHHHGDVRETDGAWQTPFSVGDGTTAGEIRLLEPSGTQYTAFKTQAQAGNVTYILPAADAAGVMTSDGAGNLSWGAGGGGGATKDIAQAGHGFTVGKVVYLNGTTYTLADKDSEATAEAVGIVSDVADTDNFTLLNVGYVSGLSGLTAGTVYFLGDSGALTATEPTTAGQVSKPLLIADTTTSGYFFNMRGQVVGGGVAGVREITTGTATAGQTAITVAYTVGYVDVYVNGVRLMPDDYTATSGTSITLDTGMALNDEYAVVTWNVVSLEDTSLMVTEPGGRLTLESGAPVMTAEQANKTVIYYAPYKTDLCPIYDGTTWARKRFAELTLTLGSNWAADSNYDLYVINDGGTIRLATGAAWTNSTTRSESLTRLNGILTNAATMTARYGNSSTVSVPANRATYVGTFRTTGSTGTTTWELGGRAAGGDEVKLFLWNAYHRTFVVASSVDTTDSWTYGSATVRSLNASTANRASFVRGLQEDSVVCRNVRPTVGMGDNTMFGVGLDVTNAHSTSAGGFLVWGAGTTTSFTVMTEGTYADNPSAGYHFLQGTENVAAGLATNTHYGDLGLASPSGAGLQFTGMF